MAPGALTIAINGTNFNVEPDSLPASYTLTQFLREKALLKGTKSMCNEGGCGVCTVTVKRSLQEAEQAINSCLVPIHACNGWHVTTIEGLGNTETGYNKIQENLADYNGSQCGFCSPGMVMTMYGAARQLGEGVKEKLESCFDGNICRCTGYRPIMNAMQQCVDIEDLTLCKNCPQRDESSAPDASFCQIQSSDGSVWYQPKSIDQLKSLLAKHAEEKYYIIAGHTGEAVYKRDGPHSIYINISDVSDMCAVSESSEGGITLGAAVTLSHMISELKRVSQSEGLLYLTEACRYLEQVANMQVRNMATWAGNLMVKHRYRDFPSDVLILLESVGAVISVLKSEISPEQLINRSMKGILILSVSFKPLPDWRLQTYKVMQTYRVYKRYRKVLNEVPPTHTLLSIALFVKLDSEMTIEERPSLVYAGISPKFLHARAAEDYLVGKCLADNDVIQGCMGLLENIELEDNPTLPSVEFRASLVKSLFFKAVLAVAGSACKAELRSGGEVLVRADRSTGQQDFQTDPSQYPLTQPLPKLDSRKQTAGEAQFIGDLPEMTGQLHAVYVKSTQASADIKSVDTSQALLAPGVVRVLTYKDIPGVNIVQNSEPLLAEDAVCYYGQPIAIVIADTQAKALAARDLVKVEYENDREPVFTIQDAIKAKSFFPKYVGDAKKGNAQEALKSCDVVVEGSVETGEQYGMHTETQRCTVLPEEGFYTVYSSTQSIHSNQVALAGLLGIGTNQLEVRVRRVGGGFGAKQSRSIIVSGGAALAARSTGRPVTMCLTLEDNMEILGRRQPIRLEYKVGVDKDLKIKAITGAVYENCGYHNNDSMVMFMLRWLDNAYFIPNWDIEAWACSTNQPNHTYIRAPGIMSMMHSSEQIIEAVAAKLNVPAIKVREANFYKEGESNAFNDVISPCLIQQVWDQVRTSADYDKRAADIEQFNKENVYKKRGISLMPVRYGFCYWNFATYMAHVTINNGDGSVIIVHGGVELGQGINTKTIQIAAHTLGIPMDMIKVQTTTSTFNINCFDTGGSVTSDMNCLAVKKACEILLKAMEPHKKDGMSWKEIVHKCRLARVDLHAKHQATSADICPEPEGKGAMFHANVFGTACSEVELDILTGNYIIRRMDLLYDCGASFSPEIDVGQIEGGVVMGLGLTLHEEYKYDPKTKQPLTTNTWTYNVPLNRDIPEQLRVTLIKDKPNKIFSLGSKIVGEPPMIFAESAVLALRNCISAYRRQHNNDTSYFSGDTPLTVEKIHLACNIDASNLQL